MILIAFTSALRAEKSAPEVVKACLIPQLSPSDKHSQQRIAQCLGWQIQKVGNYCQGYFTPIHIFDTSQSGQIRIQAEEVSFSNNARSHLKGKVEVQQNERIVSAQTAYVYRDSNTQKISRIELLSQVHYVEPGRLLIADKAIIYPDNKSGQVFNALYRMDSKRVAAVLPSWGHALSIQRFANEDYFMKEVSYSTCNPKHPTWRILAKTLKLDAAKKQGVARNAKLQIADQTVLYTPYLSFPTSDERKSGFLMPQKGFSNMGGYDLGLPYYLNLAPNYDATLMPHLYTRRGMMLGGEFRYFTPRSAGVLEAHLLPSDKAFKTFIDENRTSFPSIAQESTNRWSLKYDNHTNILNNLRLDLSIQHVSDPYYLQDFLSNLVYSTQRQLLQKGELVYTTSHWLFRGVVQRYQTLNPINQSLVSRVYEQRPDLTAQGHYNELPLGSRLSVLGKYTYFYWPDDKVQRSEGGRVVIDPALKAPQLFSWGFVTPGIDAVIRDYQLQTWTRYNDGRYNSILPRASLDTGLYFDRYFKMRNTEFQQTLEPRLFYLYTPYQDQSNIPVFDSAYTIFNYDQLFRLNRFSGYDRFSNANQISYALASRLLSSDSGDELAMVAVGQTRYFSEQKVQLCRTIPGRPPCQDSAQNLGYIPPDATYSPIAAKTVIHFQKNLSLNGDYIWNPDTGTTDNGHLNFQFRKDSKRVLNVGYNYLVNGDSSRVARDGPANKALHQLSFTYAWPFSDYWSTLGGFNYNISKGYNMMTLFGIQYDNCCWAMRLMGGQNFLSLNDSLRPRYNNNIYLQFLLKGLGSVGNSDPSGTIRSLIPGYGDIFQQRT